MVSFRECFELMARLLSDEEDMNAIGQRLKGILEDVISKNFQHGYWMDWALGRETTESTPAWNLEVEKWEWTRKEIGIKRIPTVAMVVTPRDSGTQGSDWIEERLRIYRFQRSIFRFAQSLPETVCGKLENYGAVLVTSADPSKPRLMRRKQIEAIAEQIHRFSVKELKGSVSVGIGKAMFPGEQLNESYRQALLALHLGMKSGKDIYFYSSSPKEKNDAMLELNRSLLELTRQLKEDSFSNTEVMLDRFLEQVLRLSIQNLGEVRLHLKYTILRVVGVLQERIGLDESGADELYKDATDLIENVSTTQEVIMTFRESLTKLMELSHKRSDFQSATSMKKIRDYVDVHFCESLTISALAKMAAVSPATFSRHFMKFSGVSLKTYIQNRRLGEAKRLLKSSNLPVFRISRDCGFKSNTYFVDMFRKKIGLTPQRYRQKFKHG